MKKTKKFRKILNFSRDANGVKNADMPKPSYRNSSRSNLIIEVDEWIASCMQSIAYDKNISFDEIIDEAIRKFADQNLQKIHEKRTNSRSKRIRMRFRLYKLLS